MFKAITSTTALLLNNIVHVQKDAFIPWVARSPTAKVQSLETVHLETIGEGKQRKNLTLVSSHSQGPPLLMAWKSLRWVIQQVNNKVRRHLEIASGVFLGKFIW